MILFSNLLKYGSPQCFASPEISATFGVHESVNFNSDIGQLAANIATDIIENNINMPKCDEMKNFCEANLGTCVETGSLVRLDKLDLLKDHFGNLIAVDFLFSDGHCSFKTNTLKVETKATCDMFIKTLASQLGLALNITLEKDQNSRLVINEHQIMFFEVNSHLEDKAICKFTSRLIGRKLVEHELMAKLVGSRTAIDGVFSLLGQTTTIQSVLDECLESPFQPGNVITAEMYKSEIRNFQKKEKHLFGVHFLQWSRSG